MRARQTDELSIAKRFSPPPALCAVPVTMTGTGATPGVPDQTLLMGVVAAALIGAGMWMFRRYERPQVPGLRPEPHGSPA